MWPGDLWREDFALTNFIKRMDEQECLSIKMILGGMELSVLGEAFVIADHAIRIPRYFSLLTLHQCQ